MDSKLDSSLGKPVKRLRKRDRAWNVVKTGAKRTHKGFQKIQPVLNKVKPIVKPRKALFGFILLSFLKPSMALALQMPNPVPEVEGLPGWTGNLTVALFLAGMVEESTYHTSCIVPGSLAVNIIGVPIALLGTWGFAVSASICHSVGWHTKGSPCCTS